MYKLTQNIGLAIAITVIGTLALTGVALTFDLQVSALDIIRSMF